MSRAEPERGRRGCPFCGETNGHAVNCDRARAKQLVNSLGLELAENHAKLKRATTTKTIKIRGVRGFAIRLTSDSKFVEETVMYYDFPLNSAEIKRVENYLRRKYRLPKRSRIEPEKKETKR